MRQIVEISAQKTWTWVRKENHKINWISNNSTKTTPQKPTMLKQKYLRRNKLDNVVYIQIEKKWLIT